jgi:hypothetical protein
MHSVKINDRIRADSGSIVLEATSFVTMAFSLLLVLSLQLFDVERKQIMLEEVARNSLRAYFLGSSKDLAADIEFYKNLSNSFEGEDLAITTRCVPANCETTGSLVWLELASGNNYARAFGVQP